MPIKWDLELTLGVHAKPGVVVPSRRQICGDGVSQSSLGSTEVTIAVWERVQQVLRECRSMYPVDWDDLVLLVEQLDIFRLPGSAGFGVLEAEEDEAAVAVHVELGAHRAVRGRKRLLNLEALGNGGLHLTNSAAVLGGVLDKRTALAVHDEVALVLTLLRNGYEIIDRATLAPR